MGLFNLSNIAQDTLANFAKILTPIIIIMLVLGVIYWLRSLQQGRHTNVVVVRRP
tara:strand:- start:1197 stop:1361 length:165 start_codon:yes stop_codon:yes gene_type:complete